MSIELNKLAAEFNRYFTSSNGVDVPAKVSVSRDEWRALFTAIQQAEAQQPATTEPAGYLYDFKYDDEIVRDWFTQNIDEIQFRPATCLNIRPLYAHPAPGVPEFYRIAKRKLDELQEQGFAITGYAIQRGPVRGFIDGSGFVGWWQGEPDPGAPDGCMLVKTDDMVRLASLIGPAPFEQDGKTYTFNVPNPDENLRLIGATVRAMLAAQAQKGGAA